MVNIVFCDRKGFKYIPLKFSIPNPDCMRAPSPPRCFSFPYFRQTYDRCGLEGPWGEIIEIIFLDVRSYQRIFSPGE
jgi:hypothetical protein